ncbi:recombinase family protein [Ornithobacterium rhinotracheale]|uniref:recombinase family protein n=1 Tax=Ornithobacterium rhinotracheale TaxID=28251 RepID=UPI0040372998
MIVGYARVSTKGQDLMPQINVLEEYGCEKIFHDKESSTMLNRPGFEDLKKQLRKGDLLVVYKTDRIFRSLKDMVSFIEWLTQEDIKFKSLSEPTFDTTTANGKFLLQIFAAVAEFERNLISERTKLGLKHALKRKKILGRPKGIKPETQTKYEYAYHLYHNKKMSIVEACKTAGISKASFYRIQMENRG